MYEQSLLARSKTSPARTWSRRLKQDYSTTLLSGLILKPSLGSSFAEKWTSSLEASLASPSPPQVFVEETMIQDTCGHTSCEGSESWGTLPLFSSRTLRASSAPNSQAQSGVTPQERPFCSMSSESWKGWVTTQRREYSQRAKSASPISGNECLSWALDATSRTISVSGCPRSLEQEATTWLTPAATAGTAKEPLYTAQGEPWAGEGRAYRASGVHRTLTLQMQVETLSEGRTWPTPKATEINETPEQWAKRRERPSAKSRGSSLTVAAKLEQRPPHQEAQSSTSGSHPGPQWAQSSTGGKLNPRWVETLMGLPVGWTMPSCATPWTIEQMSCDCSVTESSPPQPSEPSVSCGAGWPTPLASQRGLHLSVYFRKSIKRIQEGGIKFGPTLQVSVEAEHRGIDIDTALARIAPLIGTHDTETLVQMAMDDKKDT